MLFSSSTSNSQKKRLSIKTGIDLTAMVDVVLLIVIFFLTTSSFNKLTEIEIELPSGTTGKFLAPNPLEITVTANGSVYYAGKAVALQEIDAIIKRNPSKAITLLGDRRTRYETIVSVMDAIKQAGGSSISLTIK